MSKRVLNFSEDINLKLEELKRYLKMPINKIIYMIVNEKLENLKLNEKKYIEDLKIENSKNEVEIRFRINENEKIFLEEQMKKSGNNSLTSEIRYRLLNSIYKNKYFLPVELTELSNLNFQIKRIGININSIYKKINFKEELKNDDYINLENGINEVNCKIDELTNELKNILQFSKNRD